MPSREWRFRVDDMLAAIARVEEYARDMSMAAFLADPKTCDAVIRNLEILGEAARYMPAEIVERHPSAPWKRAREMRNVLIHAYFGVDLKTVWQTIRDDLPPLKTQLEAILKQEP